jgi:hypothetical protein
MDYLVRIRLDKTHRVAHYVHEVTGVVGALCSQKPKPAVGDQTQSGQWKLVSALPAGVQICQVCQKRKQKLDNPLPTRVERDIELLSRWDPRAAELQRKKMLAYYQQKQASR